MACPLPTDTVYRAHLVSMSRGSPWHLPGREAWRHVPVVFAENRAPSSRSASHDGGAVTSGQRYLLKWSVPLGQAEVVEYGGGEGAAEGGRCPTGPAPESLLAASTKPRE